MPLQYVPAATAGNGPAFDWRKIKALSGVEFVKAAAQFKAALSNDAKSPPAGVRDLKDSFEDFPGFGIAFCVHGPGVCVSYSRVAAG